MDNGDIYSKYFDIVKITQITQVKFIQKIIQSKHHPEWYDRF